MAIEKIELHPDRPALDGQLFDMLAEMWLCHCASRVKAYTLERYAHKIGYVRTWWAEAGPACNWVITEDSFVAFEQWLCTSKSQYGRTLAYHTRKDALRRLRQLLLWGWKRGFLNHDYTSWVPAASGSAPLRQAPPLDCLRRLFESCDRSPFPLRNRCIIAVLLGTGVRRSECAGIDAGDLQFYADGSGTIRVKAKYIPGREIQERLVAFDAATGKHIQAHVAHMNLGDPLTGPLFLSHRYDQHRLTAVGIYKVVKTLVDLAGLGKQIQGCHDLRRYFATYYSRANRGEGHGHLLSKQMGHSTYRMTAHYSLQDVEDIRSEIVSIFALLDEEDRRQCVSRETDSTLR